MVACGQLGKTKLQGFLIHHTRVGIQMFKYRMIRVGQEKQLEDTSSNIECVVARICQNEDFEHEQSRTD